MSVSLDACFTKIYIFVCVYRYDQYARLETGKVMANCLWMFWFFCLLTCKGDVYCKEKDRSQQSEIKTQHEQGDHTLKKQR